MSQTEPLQGEDQPEPQKIHLVKDILAGLTVSFSALSLGAAFGDQAHRGTLPGVLSAGMLAVITSGIGGTVVQCSGPTAPMTAVTVQVTEYAASGDNSTFHTDFPDNDPVKFVNMVIVLSAALIFILGVCQVGRAIVLVPNVVVSGFMNGIAIMIWIPKVQELLGLGHKKLEGNMAINTVLACTTTALIFGIPMITERFCKPFKKFFPGTLLAIVIVTGFAAACGGLGIQTVKTGEPIDELSDITDLFKTNIPDEWSLDLLKKAAPFALNLALLGYIDTLLTSRIVDAKVTDMYPPQDRWRPTNKALELVGQGLGNGFCALFGGIPGAQATIRSVLILNEGATSRLGGIMAGIFTIIEILILQPAVKLIPQCVLTGVLFKVGYDCFDWGPFFMYINTELLRKPHPGSLDQGRGDEPVVTHAAFAFIVIVAILQSFFSLTIVVGSSVVVYYILDRFIIKIPDLPAYNDMQVEADPEGEPEKQTSAPFAAKGSTPQRINTSGTVERELSSASMPTSHHQLG